jgi:hypothetical protein
MATNRYGSAFREQLNVLGLATATAVSAALLNPLPLLAAAVAEVGYMLFVPDSKWYERRLARQYEAEMERQRQALKDRILPTLNTEMQTRYLRLEELRRQISAPTETDEWFVEVLRKLDSLLEKFLIFAGKEVQFHSYLRSILAESRGVLPSVPSEEKNDSDRDQRRNRRVREAARPPAAAWNGTPIHDAGWVQRTVEEAQSQYDRDIEEVRRTMEKETDENTKAVLEKRADVLLRRREFISKIGTILTNLYHQLKLLEDTFGLINDEIRARSPEQILADIEDVVWQTDNMVQVLEEVSSYEQMAARLTG